MSISVEILLKGPARCTRHLRHGEPHRLDGPADLWRDGEMKWIEYGVYHRFGRPAIIDAGRTEAQAIEFYRRGYQVNSPEFDDDD